MLVNLARDIGVAFVIQLSNVGLVYLVQVLLARWMGKTEYGIYEYVTSWVLLLAIVANLGLPNAVLRFVAEYRVKADWARLRGLLHSSWILTLMTGVLWAVVGTALVLWLKVNQNWLYATPMLVGIWLVPLVAIANLQLEMARAIHQIVLAYAPFQVIWLLLALLGTFILVQNQSLTSVSALGIAVLTLFAVVVVQLVRLRQLFSSEVGSVNPAYSPRQWLSVALPLLLSAGFFIILGQTDVLMLGAAIGPEAVGLYSAAAKTAAWGVVVLMSVNSVVAPMFSALYSQGDRLGLQTLVATVAHWIFWPSGAIALVLIGFAPFFLSLFGAEFVTARWELTVLVLGNLVNAGAGSVGYLMIMTGHQNQSTCIFGLGALTNVALNAILIPRFGTLGAALATAFAMAIWNIWLHVLVVKYLDVYPSIIGSLWVKRDRR